MRDIRPLASNLVLRSRMACIPAPDFVPRDREGLRRTIAEVIAAATGEKTDEPAEESGVVLPPRSEAQREKDRILCQAWESLAPDQQAALRVATGIAWRYSLPVDRTEGFRSRLQLVTGCFLWLVGLGVLSWMVIAHLDHPLTVCIVLGVLWWCCWRQAAPETPLERWLHAREEEADLRVALALEDPGRYLAALDCMARAEYAGWEVLRGEARMPLDFTRRRKRLCERLGFVPPVISG